MSEQACPLVAGCSDALRPLPLDVLVMREFTMMDEALVFTTLGDLEGVRSCGPP